jgi:hypothetical protein
MDEEWHGGCGDSSLQQCGSIPELLETQVDRADGKGWVMLAFDTTPNYTGILMRLSEFIH